VTDQIHDLVRCGMHSVIAKATKPMSQASATVELPLAASPGCGCGAEGCC